MYRILGRKNAEWNDEPINQSRALHFLRFVIFRAIETPSGTIQSDCLQSFDTFKVLQV
jgi:hypothetical protein